MQNKGKSLLKLFLTFLKIGAFTFGGGYAMIALMENAFVSEKKWIDKDEFLDMIAIAESTPGPIAINSATYIGYTLFGVLGSLVSTLGVVLPSFTVIYIISFFLDAFLKIKIIKYAFMGIQVCVIYLIMSAGIKMAKSLKKDKFTITVFIAVTVVFSVLSLLAKNFSTILYIIICGVLGLAAYLVKKAKDGGKK